MRRPSTAVALLVLCLLPGLAAAERLTQTQFKDKVRHELKRAGIRAWVGSDKRARPSMMRVEVRSSADMRKAYSAMTGTAPFWNDQPIVIFAQRYGVSFNLAKVSTFKRYRPRHAKTESTQGDLR